MKRGTDAVSIINIVVIISTRGLQIRRIGVTIIMAGPQPRVSCSGRIMSTLSIAKIPYGCSCRDAACARLCYRRKPYIVATPFVIPVSVKFVHWFVRIRYKFIMPTARQVAESIVWTVVPTILTSNDRLGLLILDILRLYEILLCKAVLSAL